MPHLAKEFTYSVPDRISDSVVPGVRVRLRLASHLTEGYVVADSTWTGPVASIESLVSPVPVLAPDVLRTCRAVAEHYAGSVADVVRLAVPPRVAGVEEGWRFAGSVGVAAPSAPSGPGAHPFARAAARGQAARALWNAPAGVDWAAQLADLVASVAAAGRGALVVVPDARDLARLAGPMRDRVGAALAVLTADAPPRQRYEQFLAVRSGRAKVVLGTRGAVFAPVQRLALMVVWDDGDPSLAEQRAPYPHAREVAALRTHLQATALLLAGHARSPEAQRWLDDGWLVDIGDQAELRRCRPATFATVDRVRSPFDVVRRLPQSAVAALRTGLEAGPVLVGVARTGYLPVTACRDCRAVATCAQCEGPLAVAADGAVTCRRCGAAVTWRCPACSGTRLRAVRTGSRRTAEELGRMFPGVPVTHSTGDHPVAQVGAEPAIVVSTPGVEPVAVGGYTAGALLDAQEDLWRVGVRAGEDAVRRWFNAAALLRPGAPLAVNADSAEVPVQALIRWDPGRAAVADLAARRAAGFPPAVPVIQIDGAGGDLTEVVAALGAGVEVLGPREVTPGTARVLLRAADFPALRARVRAEVLARAAARRGGALRVMVDPVTLD